MKHIKMVLCAVLCFAFIISSCCFHASAAEEKTFDLMVSSTTAVPGDTVVFSLDVKNNPGIMAVTFTVHYDPEVLEYEKYIAGILSRDTSARHDGYVSIVFCGIKDRVGDGTLYGFQFKVKDTAKAGFSKVTIKNIRPAQYGDSLKGCFANWNGDRLVPTLTSGGVNVGFTGSNCEHKFGEWETVVPAACKTTGIQSHTCTICGHNAQEDIPPIGHEYDRNWTIDRIASTLSEGLMTRHCTRSGCTATSDLVTFTVRDAEGNGFLNAVGTVIAPNSWKPLGEIMQEIEEQEKEDKKTEEENPSVETPDNIVENPQEENDKDDTFSEDDIVGADDLVENVKKEDSTLVKVHDYLFGAGDKIGLLEMLSNSISELINGSAFILPVLVIMAVLLI